MKKTTLYIVVVCAVMIALVSSITAGTRNAKARYYYLAATEQEAKMNKAEAYELYKRALDLDSSYAEAAYSVGETRLQMGLDEYQTLEGLLASADLMKKYVDENPRDYTSSVYYAYVVSELRDTPQALRIFERLDSLFDGKEDLMLRLAQAYAETDSVDKGLAVLNRLERISGISPNLSIRKMTFHLMKNDTTGAVSECDALVNFHPNDPVGWLVRSSLYEMLGKNDSVISSLLTAERLDPENGATKLNLARFYEQQGDSIASDRKMYEALMCDDLSVSDKVDALANYLQTLITDSADTSRGDALFNELNNQMPFEPSLIDLSSRYNAAKGDLKTAEEDARRALALEPNNHELWNRLFSYMALQDEFDKILPEYRRAKEVTTPDETMVMMVSSALQMDKRYDDAISVVVELIHDKYPALPITQHLSAHDMKSLEKETLLDKYKLSTFYNQIGDLYHLKNEMDSTYTAYDNAIEVFADNPMVLNNYAYFLSIYGGDLEKADRMASKAIKLDENNPTYLDTYAWVLFKKKEYLQAKLYQANAIDIAERDGDISFDLYDHMGDILFFLDGNADEALKYWEKALELDNENSIIRNKVEHKTYFNE